MYIAPHGCSSLIRAVDENDKGHHKLHQTAQHGIIASPRPTTHYHDSQHMPPHHMPHHKLPHLFLWFHLISKRQKPGMTLYVLMSNIVKHSVY